MLLRVRDLFEQAKKNAPCIIFIDELDAIGKSRSGSMGVVGGNDEREQTLNQLLTEMDGFASKDKPVIVLAATNQPEVLDTHCCVLVVSTRQVLVDRPDLSGRKTILEIYAKKVKLADGVDLDRIAQATSGFAGADLANLVNEAALLAARAKRTKVEQEDLGEAIERVVAGLEEEPRAAGRREEGGGLSRGRTRHRRSPDARRQQGGQDLDRAPRHELLCWLHPAAAHRRALPQFTRRPAGTDRHAAGRPIGGRVVFGKITTGASNDLQRATDIAEQMVGTYGMSDTLGPLAYDKQGGGQFLGGGNNPRRTVSDATAQAIDKEVRALVDNAHEQALAILRQNMALLETIAQKILEKEVIEGDELKDMLNASVLPEAIAA